MGCLMVYILLRDATTQQPAAPPARRETSAGRSGDGDSPKLWEPRGSSSRQLYIIHPAAHQLIDMPLMGKTLTHHAVRSCLAVLKLLYRSSKVAARIHRDGHDGDFHHVHPNDFESINNISQDKLLPEIGIAGLRGFGQPCWQRLKGCIPSVAPPPIANLRPSISNHSSSSAALIDQIGAQQRFVLQAFTAVNMYEGRRMRYRHTMIVYSFCDTAITALGGAGNDADSLGISISRSIILSTIMLLPTSRTAVGSDMLASLLL